MLKNYLLLTFRNIARHKTFSAINILGLAVGMSVCLLNILIIKDQRSTDRFHAHHDRIYRVITSNKGPDYASSPALLAPVLLHEYSGVEEAVRLANFDGNADYKGTALPVRGLFADQPYFRVFSFELSAGDKEKALAEPFSIVISQETANRFFGLDDPLGKVLAFPNFGDFLITGVLKEVRQRTHLDADVLVSFSTIPVLQKRGLSIGNPEDWKDRWHFYNYVLLEKGRSPAQTEIVLSEIAKRVYAPPISSTFRLQALTDITLGQDLHNPLGNIMIGLDLYIGLALAAIILLTACFNYVGLTVAASLKRAKEIGIRKVVGAQRAQIAGQFLGETVIMALLALVLACVFLDWLLPAFNSLQMVRNALNAYITIDLAEDYTVYLFFIAFSVFTGLLAGIFPALHMSALLPVKVLRGLAQIKGLSGFTLRKVLLVTQFSLSLVFIISALVIHKQYRHMRWADYGFEQENVVSVELRGNSYERFRNELMGSTNVLNVSASSAVMGGKGGGEVFIQSSHSAVPIEAAYFSVDPSYITNFDLALVAGRNFLKEISGDSVESVILNETAVQRLGLKNDQDAIGQAIQSGQDTWRIVGVVKDFHYSWLKREIGPLLLRYDPSRLRYAFVRIAPVDRAGAISSIEQAWQRVNGDAPFRYQFLDVQISAAYADFNDIARLMSFVAGMAIFISCLGLLGMALHSAESRRKEIGVRKVLGASAAKIALLLSQDIAKLLVIAVTIAAPIAWFLDSMWLNNFAYRIDFVPAIILLGIALTAILALATIASQTAKAALANPVEALRYE